MKTTILTLAAAATFAATLSAQMPAGIKLIANVPFAFHQGDKSMPAGKYELWQSHDRVVTLTNYQGKATAVSVFSPQVGGAPGGKGYLAFKCYGESKACFLREIAVPGKTTLMAIGASKAEKERTRAGAVTQISRVYTSPGTASAEE